MGVLEDGINIQEVKKQQQEIFGANLGGEKNEGKLQIWVGC